MIQHSPRSARRLAAAATPALPRLRIEAGRRAPDAGASS